MEPLQPQKAVLLEDDPYKDDLDRVQRS